jgi:DNA-binding NarL/FixJ family response regulator
MRLTVLESGDQVVTLSKRERQVLYLVATGLPNKQIAWHLHIVLGTVKVYLSHLLAGLGLSNRVELTLWALRHPAALTGVAIPFRQAGGPLLPLRESRPPA